MGYFNMGNFTEDDLRHLEELSKFTISPRSKKDQVLDKHRYTVKCYHPSEDEMEEYSDYIREFGWVYFIIPEWTDAASAIAMINPGVSGPAHYDGAILRKKDESWKTFFQRLGWVDEDGNIL